MRVLYFYSVKLSVCWQHSNMHEHSMRKTTFWSSQLSHLVHEYTTVIMPCFSHANWLHLLQRCSHFLFFFSCTSLTTATFLGFSWPFLVSELNSDREHRVCHWYGWYEIARIAARLLMKGRIISSAPSVKNSRFRCDLVDNFIPGLAFFTVQMRCNRQRRSGRKTDALANVASLHKCNKQYFDQNHHQLL